MKVKVTWYLGDVERVYTEISSMIVDSESVIDTSWSTILPEDEKKRYDANFKYCIRYIELVPDKVYSIDYGSYSKFVMLEAIDSEN